MEKCRLIFLKIMKSQQRPHPLGLIVKEFQIADLNRHMGSTKSFSEALVSRTDNRHCFAESNRSQTSTRRISLNRKKPSKRSIEGERGIRDLNESPRFE